MRFPPPTNRQAQTIWLALTGLAAATLVSLLVLLIWALGRVINALSPVLWPLAVAGVIAYLLDPVVDYLERKGTPRGRAIIFVFVLALMLIAALFSSVVPRIIHETSDFVSRVPAYALSLQKRVEDWINNPPRIIQRFFPHEVSTNRIPVFLIGTNAGFSAAETNVPVLGPLQPNATNTPSVLQSALDSGNLQSATGWAAKAIPKVGGWVLSQLGRVASWFGVLAGLALVPVYAFYFLLEKRGISSKWPNYLPLSDSSLKEELIFVLNSINSYLIAFFRGQVLVAICDGIMYGVGFLAIGLPYAVLLGAMAVPLTMIPFLGAIVTCAAALIIALVQYGDWLHPLLVLGVFGVVQALEGTLVAPKIMGNRVGLHPLTIIVAVMAGTTLLGGLLGGILAIPLTAALRVLMFRYVWKRKPAIDRTPDQEPGSEVESHQTVQT